MEHANFRYRTSQDMAVEDDDGFVFALGVNEDNHEITLTSDGEHIDLYSYRPAGTVGSDVYTVAAKNYMYFELNQARKLKKILNFLIPD